MADQRHVKVFASVEQFLDQADSASKNLCRVKGIVKWIGKPRPGTGQYEGHTYRSLAITDTQEHEALELKCVFKDAETKRIDNLDGHLITVQGYCNTREGIKYLNSTKLIQDHDAAAPQATPQTQSNSDNWNERYNPYAPIVGMMYNQAMAKLNKVEITFSVENLEEEKKQIARILGVFHGVAIASIKPEDIKALYDLAHPSSQAPKETDPFEDG